MLFLPTGIINKITLFLRLKLYFDLFTSFIFSVLHGINEILKAIFLLFTSTLFEDDNTINQHYKNKVTSSSHCFF